MKRILQNGRWAMGDTTLAILFGRALILLCALCVLCGESFGQGNQQTLLVFDTIHEMVQKGNPKNAANNVVLVLGFDTIFDGMGGTFIATNTVTSTNTSTRIYSGVSGWSWELVFGTPVPGGTGEANVGANLGTGKPIYDSKSGVTLRFNSFTNGAGITLSSNANTYTFSIESGSITDAMLLNPKVDIANGTHNVTATGSSTARSVQNRFAEVINVMDFGAAAGADSTAAFTNAYAVAAATTNAIVYVPPGREFLIDGVAMNGITIPKNTTLYMVGATLRLIGTTNPQHRVIYIGATNGATITNVTVIGGTIIGDRANPVGGETGMGIGIQNATNVTIRGVTIRDMWTDGIAVAGVDDLLIEDCTIDNCRRNGGSMILGARAVVRRSKFLRTNGTSPQAGFDMEPNPGDYVHGYTFEDCLFESNLGNGLYLIGKSNIEGTNGVVRNCIARFNGGSGIKTILQSRISIQGLTTYSNVQYGLYLDTSTNATVANVTAYQNEIYGVYASFLRKFSFSGINSFSNTVDGVYLAGASEGSLSATAWRNGGRGINVAESSDVTVMPGMVVENGADGLRLGNTTDSQVNGGIFAGNGIAGSDNSTDNVTIETESHRNVIRGLKVVKQARFTTGTAQATGNSSTTITLAAAETDSVNNLAGCRLRIVAGTGNGATVYTIASYDESTKIATITGTFSATPDNTSVYEIGANAIRSRFPIRISSGCVDNNALNNFTHFGGQNQSTVSDSGTNTQIENVDGNYLLQMNGSINLVPGPSGVVTADGVTFQDGSTFQENAHPVYIRDPDGAAVGVINITGAYNTIVDSSTNGGSIIFIAHGTGALVWNTDGTNNWAISATGKLLNVSGGRDIAESTNRIGTLYATTVNLPGGDVATLITAKQDADADLTDLADGILTGSKVDMSTFVNNFTLWDGSQASRTWTANLSGTDPVWTYSSGVANLSTGTLQQGSTAVSLVGHAHAASDVTSGAFDTARIAGGTATSGFVPKSNGDGTATWAADSSGSGYATVQEEGSGLTARSILNFIGGGVTAADNGGSTRTDVTITRAGIVREIWIDAGAMVPDLSLPAEAATLNPASTLQHDVYNFDDNQLEKVWFRWTPPSTWDAGVLGAKVVWTTAAASGNVKWDLAGYAFGDGASMTSLPGSGNTVFFIDAVQAANTLHMTGVLVDGGSAKLTVNGTAAVAKPIYFGLDRDNTTSGDVTGDVRLLGVWLQYTESATEPSAF